jgi:hypothetical protein
MSDIMMQRNYPCKCGRSPTGFCVGLHEMNTEQYKAHLEQQRQKLEEQTKPQFLVD